MRNKSAEIVLLKRIIESHKETIEILEQDGKKLLEKRDELVEDKADLIHDLLEVKDAKDKLEMDVNHLESEARELFAMNITNITSDFEKEEKLRMIEDASVLNLVVLFKLSSVKL